MAGDWIKMRGNLWDDPRVSRLVDETDSSEAAVIGALYWLWATADQHTADGVMPGLTLKGIDRKTGVKGFAQALCDINWLQALADGVQIVAFEEHNGASAKKRCQTAKRVANHTAANGRTPTNQQDANDASADSLELDNAPLTHHEIETNAHCVSSALAREREEKIREEERTHTPRDEPKPLEPDRSVCVLVCQAMRDAGIGDTNPWDAGLAVLVGKGATPGMFAAAAPMAVKLGKGFAYAVGIVKNQLSAAAPMADAPMAVPSARPGKADVSRVTVPASATADAALRHLEADAAIPRSGTPAELVERLARRRGSVAAGAGA